MPKTSEPALKPLDRLVGSWATEATHPAMPGLVVRGSVSVEWLEGERFLIHRARTDHPDFPDSISIIGFTERDRVDAPAAGSAGDDESQLTMHYFDSRGVFRVYQVEMDEESWRIWRDAPGMSQRFTGKFSDGDQTLAGVWQMCEDGERFRDDLAITYRRQS